MTQKSFSLAIPQSTGGGGGGGAVDSVNGQTGIVVLNKINIGLSNVDNTADANKPVSTAQGTAISTAKSEAISDANDYTDTAVSDYIPTSEKGAALGVATLGADIRLPLAQGAIIGTVTPNNSPISLGDDLQAIADKATGQIDSVVDDIAVLNSTSARRRGTFANKSVIAFNSKMPVANLLSDGIITTETSRMVFKSIGIVSDIEVLFTNFEELGTTTTTSAGAITIEASIEYPSGTLTRLTFDGGNDSVLIKKGFTKKTDVFLGNIPPNASFWVRTNVTVTLGQIWHKAFTLLGASPPIGGEGLVTGSNLVMSGAIANSGGAAYGPSAIIGVSSSRNGSILLRGDSISAGAGDSGQPQYSQGRVGGLYGRALHPNFPTLEMNESGQNLFSWLKNNSAYNTTNFLDQILSTCQFSLSNLGINDLIIGQSLASIQNSFLQNSYFDKSKGIKAYQTTITPRTTSTDGWVTEVNQTVTAYEATRVAYNTWLRDGCPIDVTTQVAAASGASGSNIIRIGDVRHPVEGIFEVANLVESSLNSGKWTVVGGANTADGLHPNPTGYIKAVVGIDTTVFTV